MIKNARIKQNLPTYLPEMSIGSSGYIFTNEVEIAEDGSVWVKEYASVYNGITDRIIFHVEKTMRASKFLYKMPLFGPTFYKLTRRGQSEYELDMMNWVDEWHVGKPLEKIDTVKYFKIGQADLKICKRRL